ncbi:Myc-type [Macleaya cordata]|uniref:Myc-type n=1 Tax=Macleaya cordata TaxID=56857 RepID=A0A200R8K9_MACCD|nr:Myc-type [Macleaya cordata]
MYSSNHKPGQDGGLSRYVSAPSALLTSVVDSVIGSDQGFSNVGSENHLMGTHHRYLSGDSSSMTNESGCKANGSSFSDFKQAVYRNERAGNGSTPTLQRAYGFNQLNGGGGGGGSSPLIRHSSSPAGFLNNLMVENGFSITKGIEGYNNQAAGTNTVGHGRLRTQLSFTQDSLSQISEVGENGATGVSSSDDGFTIGSWDNDTNSIHFSTPSNKRTKNNNGDFVAVLDDIETQSLFNLAKTSLEMEKLFGQNDTVVTCKTRARRGFATHPRSIAERERRGRISDKLRKLQEFVPNMDKQTSIADMLDLAMKHIKGLQGEVQKLKKHLESCTCGCKQATKMQS